MKIYSFSKTRRALLFGFSGAIALLTPLTIAMPSVHADVGLPAWWSGQVCDTNNYPGSYQLSTTSVYDGVIACGPGPNQGGTDHAVQFTGSSFTNYEWECVELSERYLDLVFGQLPYSAPGGKDIVANYPSTNLTKITNNGTSGLPSPGDVFSEGGTQANPYGHTGVITAVNVTNGSGSVSTIEQNASSAGVNSISVSGNVLQSNVTGWLHNPNASATVRTILTSDGHVQAFKITNGALSENWYNPANGSAGAWTQPVAMPSQPAGTPTVALRSGQNVIDIFVRGSNNQVYATWYNFQYGTWGGWVGLGGGPLSFTSDPQAIATSDGHDQVFGTGGNVVEQIWYNPNGGNYGGWTTSPGGISAVGSPAIAPRPGQTVTDAFVHAGNNQVYETWYNWSNGQWGGWIGMGGGPLSFTSDPQAIVTPDSSDEVFGTGGGYIEQNWFNPSNGHYGGWTTSAGGISAVGSPALAGRWGQTGQNAIDEFVRSSNNQVYETWYNFATGGWGGWIGMGGGPEGVTSDPQMQQTSDGHDQVFGTGGGLVEQNWFNPPDGTYGGWITF